MLDIDGYQPVNAETYGTPITLDLRKALSLAAKHSRDYQSSKESLYLAAASVWSATHDWEWNVTNSVDGLLRRDFDDQETTKSGGARLGFQKRFFSGARLTTSIAVDALRYMTGDSRVNIGTVANLTLTQPLLSRRGELVAREPLTQAERSLVYALRSYVRNRTSLLLNVADRYYGVLSAMDALENAERDSERVKSAREETEWMAKSGRGKFFQLDQAEQRELRSRSDLVRRQASFQSSKDTLKQVLGLPLSVTIEVDRQDLTRLADTELPTLDLTAEEARDYALANRLDYATAKGELEDSERAVLIAADRLRATLDLDLRAGASSPRDSRLRAITWEKGTVSAGLSGELPFDKTDDVIAYKRALIRRDQKQRQLDTKKDQIIARLRLDWRNLNAAEDDYKIQKMSLALAERRVESTDMLLRAGRSNVRDSLDAQSDLIDAQNSLTNSLVDRRLTWLDFLHDLERLPTNPDDLWSPALDLVPSQTGPTAGPAVEPASDGAP